MRQEWRRVKKRVTKPAALLPGQVRGASAHTPNCKQEVCSGQPTNGGTQVNWPVQPQLHEDIHRQAKCQKPASTVGQRCGTGSLDLRVTQARSALATASAIAAQSGWARLTPKDSAKRMSCKDTANVELSSGGRTRAI